MPHAGFADSLLAALTAAIAFVSIRYIPKGESSLSIALSFHTMGVLTTIVRLAVGAIAIASVLIRILKVL